MSTIKKVNFFESEEGVEARSLLQTLWSDKAYKTDSSYSTDSESYPDNLIPFVQKHMDYLSNHPSVNIKMYVANLRIMTRIR